MLDRLEAFASMNGPTFYGLPLNTGTVQLERNEADEAVPGLMNLRTAARRQQPWCRSTPVGPIGASVGPVALKKIQA